MRERLWMRCVQNLDMYWSENMSPLNLMVDDHLSHQGGNFWGTWSNAYIVCSESKRERSQTHTKTCMNWSLRDLRCLSVDFVLLHKGWMSEIIHMSFFIHYSTISCDFWWIMALSSAAQQCFQVFEAGGRALRFRRWENHWHRPPEPHQAMAWHGMAWHGWCPHVAVLQTATRQVGDTFGAKKAVEADGTTQESIKSTSKA